MHVEMMPLGMCQTNCYLVWGENSKTCVVIDPGDAGELILRKIDALGLTVEAVFLTHGHFDHVGAVQTLVEKTGCALWMRESDWSVAPGYGTAQLFPLANCNFCEVQFYEHDESLQAAGLTFTVWETPGHTWGSVCILTEDVLFTGDTLFAGTIGRTDFPGSSWETMQTSLEFLAAQEKNYTVYPGHGDATTLDTERKHNPFLRGVL